MKKQNLPIRLGAASALVIAVLLSGAITLLALWLQPNALRTVVSGFLKSPALIVLNALPVGLTLLALAFLLRNVFFAAALTELIVCGLSLANRIKIEVRNEPVFPRDLELLKEVGSAVGSYDIRFPWAQIAVLVLVFVALALLGAAIRCKPFFHDRLWREALLRLLGAAASAGTLAALVVTVYASNDLYNSFPATNPYYVPSVFNELGFPYCFTHHFTTYTVDRPAGFDRAEAETWDSAPAAQAGQAPAVHVVMVMNEAFSDLTDDPAFTYAEDDDPLPNLHALRQDPNCISGHIVVPGFAGGTANTEFDVLTGMQTNALSATTTSAFRAVNRDLDSLYRVFRADGCRTSYLHPGDAWFYNRENVYRWLGAEEIVFAQDMQGLTSKGRWVTDASLAEQVEAAFDRAVENGKTLFNYTTTIQNHMSYTADKYGADYVFPPVQTDAALSDTAKTLLSVYIEGARDADAMLGRLWQYFAAQDEPVVLVFFGDHLPYLGGEQLAYRELGIGLTPDETGTEGFLRAYETPYVIWANRAAADALDWKTAAVRYCGDGGRISACYLGATVLELTGRVQESPWFQYLTDLRRELPVIQKDTVMLSDGSLTTVEGLRPEQRALVEKLRCWSYYKLKYKDVAG